MTAPPKVRRSPTPGLLLGLVVTLAAVVAYKGYITYQIKGLRELQSNIIDPRQGRSRQAASAYLLDQYGLSYTPGTLSSA